MQSLKIAKAIPKIDEGLEEFVNSLNLAENMNECLWVGDKNHKTVYVNPMFEQVTGYSLKECLGKECEFFFDGKSKQIIRSHHELRPRGIPSQYEATMLSKDGKRIPLLISGAPIKQGGTIGIFANLTKIKELSNQERYLKEVISYSAEAIVLLDKKRRIKLWNTGAANIFGYKESEILNKSVQILIPPEEEDTNKQILQEVEEKKVLKNFEVHRVRKDGQRIDVSVSVTKVTDEEGRFMAYLLIYRDITPLKKTNEELQKRFEAIQDVYKELGIQRRQVDYIYDIGRVALSEENLAALEKLIVNGISMLSRCDGATLRLYDKEQDILRLKCCFGLSAKWWSKSKINFKNSLAQEALTHKRPLIIDNVHSTSKHQGVKLLKSHNFNTLIIIPLFTPAKIIGSLSIYAEDPAKFRMIETDFLEKFGTQASLALSAKLDATKLDTIE